MGRKSLPVEFKTTTVSLRLQKRLIFKMKRKATRFGMKQPAYISQLIEKDTENEPEPKAQACRGLESVCTS